MSRPIRVVHIVQSLQVGGLERMVGRLALAHRSQGFDPAVIAYDADGALGAWLRSEGIDVVARQGTPGLQPALVPWLAVQLRRLGAELVHTHHVGPLIYGGMAARLAGARLIHTEHSLEQLDTPRRRRLARLVAGASPVVAVAHAVAEGASRTYGRGVHVVENGVPVPADPSMRPLVTGRRPLQAVIAARLSPEKGVDVAIEALASAGRWSLVILGQGSEEQRLRSLVARLGLGHRVTFRGAVDDPRIFLRQADAAVLSSRREGLPLFVLEAMAEGVPVVATDVGGVAEALGPAGVVVPPESPGSLAEALGELAGRLDAGRGPAIGKALHTRAASRFSLSVMAGRYATLYAEALGVRPRPGSGRFPWWTWSSSSRRGSSAASSAWPSRARVA